MLERKVGGVNGKEVIDPRTFTSLSSPSLSQTTLMPQEIPSVSLDADRYIAHPETIKESVVVGPWIETLVSSRGYSGGSCVSLAFMLFASLK